MNLSAHFTYDELISSELALRQGFDNTPPTDAILELQRLCEFVLEPVRSLLSVPLHINSGYRSLTVNRLIGGAANSAHLAGRAADVVPIGFELKSAFEIIRHSQIPFDQIILECNTWLHLSIAEDPRRQALTAKGGPGHWTYEVVV